MNIRKFKETDLSALIDLWNAVFPDDPAHNEPSIVIKEKLSVDDLIFIAEQQGRLIAACMAGYDGHRGWLYAVAVSQENRRAGIGGALVKYTIRSLEDIGCKKVNLQIRVSNTQVKSFYESLGFSIEERLSMGKFIS